MALLKTYQAGTLIEAIISLVILSLLSVMVTISFSGMWSVSKTELDIRSEKLIRARLVDGRSLENTEQLVLVEQMEMLGPFKGGNLHTVVAVDQMGDTLMIHSKWKRDEE